MCVTPSVCLSSVQFLSLLLYVPDPSVFSDSFFLSSSMCLTLVSSLTVSFSPPLQVLSCSWEGLWHQRSLSLPTSTMTPCNYDDDQWDSSVLLSCYEVICSKPIRSRQNDAINATFPLPIVGCVFILLSRIYMIPILYSIFYILYSIDIYWYIQIMWLCFDTVSFNHLVREREREM